MDSMYENKEGAEMEIIIRDRWNGDPIYTAKDVENVLQAVTAAIGDGKSLSEADLSRADLSGADLYGANLYGANISGANLYGANLYGANLSGADLSRANLSRADLSGADLSGADLYWADLSRANLSRADLSGANLSGADLSRADLSRADLSGADLYGANLYGAKNITKYLTTPMYILLDQIGEIRAYKLVTAERTGPTYPSITYEVGKTYTESNFCTDESQQCAAGINLATLDWCLKGWRPGFRIFIASFKRKHGNDDNICVPIGSDGRFRVKSCKIVGEVDLVEIGFINEKGERI
jgi:uncharacterized protein YjbI with pentapeptide repeats